jgi:hypothetical protein
MAASTFFEIDLLCFEFDTLMLESIIDSDRTSHWN